MRPLVGGGLTQSQHWQSPHSPSTKADKHGTAKPVPTRAEPYIHLTYIRTYIYGLRPAACPKPVPSGLPSRLWLTIQLVAHDWGAGHTRSAFSAQPMNQVTSSVNAATATIADAGHRWMCSHPEQTASILIGHLERSGK